MKVARSAILLSLLTVFLLGNIGINVFKHICQEDGVSISYILDRGEEHCGNHHEHTELPPCCQAGDQEEKEDCCDDEVYYLKLQVDANQHAAFHFQMQATVVELPGIVSAEFIPSTDKRISARLEDPPPISGKEILIRKQVWNI